MLLAHGAEVNATDDRRQGRTALGIVVARGCTDAVTTLLENDADMNLRGAVPCCALDLAVQSKLSAKTISVLLAYGAEINARDWSSSTVLHHATERGHLDAIGALAVHSADLDARYPR